MPAPPPLTEDQIRSLAPDDILARGYDYWRAGAVRDRVRQGAELRAAVAGSQPEPYDVRIGFGIDGRPAYSCACPDFQGLPRRRKRPCKHVVAVLLEWAHSPESFALRPVVEELLAGTARDELLDEIREMLRSGPALSGMLAQPAEPPAGRRRAMAPAQVDRQVNFALSRHRREPAVLHDRLVAILEQGGALIQSGDPTNAARLLTRLLARLIPLLDEPELEPRRLVSLARRTLDALDLAAIEATWPAAEREAWLQQLMEWWAGDRHGLADALMDLILHSYRPEDADLVERWLRALLRQPRHAGEQTDRWWRERVLSFLLGFYEATGRHQAFLDLCWEEEEDARAALKFVELGQVEEARRLAVAGLGSAASHRALAEQLWERGDAALALEVAERGLKYRDAWQPALQEWLATRYLALGEVKPAWAAAQGAWRQAPSLERYHLVRAAGRLLEGEAPGRPWPATRRELLEELERRGEMALLVTILLDEGDPQAAAGFLPAVEPAARREALAVRVAEALLAAGDAGRALPLFFDAAELMIAGRTRAHYARAAALLARARREAAPAGLASLFEERLRELLERYSRRRAFLEELAAALGAEGRAG